MNYNNLTFLVSSCDKYAFVLGTKLGAIQWIFLGVITAVFTHQDAFRGKSNAALKQDFLRVKRWWKDSLISLGWWLLFCLVAVSFINFFPMVSILLSLSGGIFLGINQIAHFRKIFSKIPKVNKS